MVQGLLIKGVIMNRYDSKEWAILVEIQNENTNIDILTITGFMKDDAFKVYVEEKQEQYNK